MKKNVIVIFAIIFVLVIAVVMLKFAPPKTTENIAPQNEPEDVEEKPLAEEFPSEEWKKEAVELTFPDNTLDTSDWQTFRNEEFGFEVRYPGDWEVTYRKGACSTAGYGVAFVDFLPKTHAPNDDRGTFICIDNRNLQNYTQELTEKGWHVKKKVLINDILGIITDRTNENNEWLSYDNYKIMNDGMMYRFIESGDDYTDIFQQILLSFRFIE